MPLQADGGGSLPSIPPAYAPVRPAILRTVAEAAAFIRPKSIPSVDATLPRGDSRPVLVLPVIGRGDGHAAPARVALDALGYQAFGWGLGRNMGPTPRLLAGVENRLLALHHQHGRVDVVGFSMGGIFARLLAHLHPDKVRQVVTVCSPFRAAVDSAFLPLRPLLPVIWRAPGLLEVAARVEDELPVPGTFIFSRSDGIVAWESCIDPSLPDDCFEIPGQHVTIVQDPDVRRILAHRLPRDLSA